MKTVITGAAGFAASHLIQLLKGNSSEEIFAWAKDEQETEKIQLDREHVCIVDITDENCVKQTIENIVPDRVYHLAAQASVGSSWKIPEVTM